MAESDSGEKTEDATPQKREDFRKRGQVVQTKELGTVFTLFAAILAMWLLGRFLMQNLVDIFSLSFSDYILIAVKQGDYLPIVHKVFKLTLYILAPILGLFWLISFSASVSQVGILINEEALQFKLEKLNPTEGIKRLFSMRSVVEGLKAVFKVTCVVAVVFLIIKSEILSLPNLVHLSIAQIMTYIGDMSVKLFAGVGFFMIIIAAADYFFQRFDMENKMKMTKQEVKEEMKSREGDPLIKARIRRTQREMSQRRMMEDVPKADVIITNPTHLAIAIKYDATMVAPTIIAKGADLIADNIRALAKEHNIPIVENKPLARVIYKTIKIGQGIPKELYTAVAEVLSYVFRLKNKVRA